MEIVSPLDEGRTLFENLEFAKDNSETTAPGSNIASHEAGVQRAVIPIGVPRALVFPACPDEGRASFAGAERREGSAVLTR